MSSSEIKEQLIMAQQQGNLVEVYNFDDDDIFNVGFVIAIDPLFVLLLGIDWDGKINGLTAIRLTSIHKVQAYTDYLTTVSIKCKVAEDHHYFDIWHLQEFLRHHDYQNKNILRTLLTDSFENKLPVVIGTDKYKGEDDFEGLINNLSEIKLDLHYINEHDLSSMWDYEILLVKIDYLRVRGTQMMQIKQIMQNVFGVNFDNN
ncbi:hypothetical protein [Limosilactobacillus coleohominis]|uniref:Uncharacterized protein n=1 Tax=Limosilactobacillus coleohominis TaxID=181675 RepID=A0ABS2GXF0_9LACO|nr:hypothetical protein [Limosilactobacillus coleohominis]MBM6940536.1 hypothetical protein [Limosilactobacillus coleohominis]MBM6954829.1 hypothetical protein [Limosilactobacillus coleohominis]